MSQNSNKYHRYGMIAVIGCCMLYGAVSGIGANCKGIFYSVVAQDLGVKLPSVTLYSTFYGFAAALTIPISTKLFHRISARIFLTVQILIYAATEFLMGSVHSIPALYVIGAIQGIPGGFLVLYPLQHIIGNWYPHKKGTLMGIAVMSSGILGVFLNPIASGWITAYGWRATYRLLGLLIAAIGLPATLLMLSKDPQEKGCEAIRVESGGKARQMKADAGTFSLMMYLVFMLLIDLAVSFPQIFPSISLSLGRDAAFGAKLVSIAMVGNILIKLIVGCLNDRIGARLTTIVAAVPIMTGALIMAFATEDALLIAAAFGGGSILSIYSIQFPLLFRELCSRRQFERYYGYTCSINSIVGAFSASALTMVYSEFDSYRPVMICCAAAMAAVVGICIYFEMLARRNNARADTSPAWE